MLKRIPNSMRKEKSFITRMQSSGSIKSNPNLRQNLKDFVKFMQKQNGKIQKTVQELFVAPLYMLPNLCSQLWNFHSLTSTFIEWEWMGNCMENTSSHGLTILNANEVLERKRNKAKWGWEVIQTGRAENGECLAFCQPWTLVMRLDHTTLWERQCLHLELSKDNKTELEA